MVEKIFLWQGENGMHARPSGIIVNGASGFESEVKITFGEKSADAKSVFSLMGLGIKKGDKIKLTATGKDEEAAAEKIGDLLEENSLALKT